MKSKIIMLQPEERFFHPLSRACNPVQYFFHMTAIDFSYRSAANWTRLFREGRDFERSKPKRLPAWEGTLHRAHVCEGS